MSAIVRSGTPTPISRDGRTLRVKGWEQHAVVQACARVITDVTATIPYVALGPLRPDGTREPLPSSHPLARLLAAPAPRMTPRTMRAAIALDLVVYGNALLRIDRTVPRALALRRVNPEGLSEVYVDGDGDAVRYVWTDVHGRVIQAGVEDVLHFRDLAIQSPRTPDVFGFPRAAAALVDIASDLEASSYVRQVVGNDGAPPFIVMMHEQATAGDAIAMQERYIERQVNRGRRGVPEFLGGVRDVKSLGFTLSDLEFPNLRRISREDICAAFGVDPRMVGIGSASNDGGLSGSQYQEARARLVHHTVEPLLHLVEDELTTWLAPEFGDCAVQYDREALRDLVEDDAATSERIRAEWAASLRSWDEARAALKLPSEVEPSTLFVLPTNDIVSAGRLQVDMGEVDELLAQPEPSTEMPATVGPTGDVQATALNGAQVEALKAIIAEVAIGNLPAATARPLILASFPGVAESLVDAMLSGLNGFTPPQPEAPQPPPAPAPDGTRSQVRNGDGFEMEPEDEPEELLTREAQWRAFDRSAAADEPKYRQAANEQFGRDQARVRRIVTSGTTRADGLTPAQIERIIKAVGDAFSEDGEAYEEWLRGFEPLIGGTYRDGYTGTAKKFGYPVDIASPQVAAAIRERATRLATLVGRTTAREITAAVLAANEAGLSARQAAKLIDETVFGGMAGKRATVIARTETVGALNRGNYDSAQASGVFQSKEWLTQGDDRVRDSHADIDGERVAIDGPFSNGLASPGDNDAPADEVIQCRCTLLFHTDPV